jgi:hypothetical protein
VRIADDDLLAHFREQPCENCGRRPPNQAAHVMHGGRGDAFRIDLPINLLSLCLWCHGRNHSAGRGHLTQSDMLKLVAKRTGFTEAVILGELWRLRRLDKHGREPHGGTG